MANLEKAAAVLDRALRDEEGERLEPYLCDSGVPTIGVGATTYLDGRKVRLGDPPITAAQMNRMLAVEIDRYMHAVLEMVEGECTTNQLIALVLCAYNIGLAGLRGSTMIRQHCAGNYEAAARAFTLWNKYRPKPGSPLQEHPVLTARRLRESARYATPDDGAPAGRVPQAVEAESSLVKSPIAQGGAVTAGAGAITAATSVSDQITETSGVLGAVKAVLAGVKELVHGLADAFGLPPGALLAIALIVVGYVVMKNRAAQRKDGWS